MKTSTPDSPKAPSPLKLLLLSDPGGRKTTLGLQFPGVHVLDCDQNLDGPDKWLRANGHKDLSYTFDPIRSDDNGKMLDVSECFDRILDILARFHDDEAYKNRRVVFVDSLSHVNEFIIRKVLKLKSKPSMEINLWTDFSSAAYTLLVARLDQTGKAILCSCHLEKISESDTGNIMRKKVVEINPLFSGRVGDCIGAFFTDVWMLEKRASSGGRTELWLLSDRTPKCSHLKNSVNMPAELNVTGGFKVIEPYLQGRI